MEQLDLYRVVDYVVERPFGQRVMGTGNIILEGVALLVAIVASVLRFAFAPGTFAPTGWSCSVPTSPTGTIGTFAVRASQATPVRPR